MVTIAMSDRPATGATGVEPAIRAALDSLGAAGLTFTEVAVCPEPSCPVCAPVPARSGAAA